MAGKCRKKGGKDMTKQDYERLQNLFDKKLRQGRLSNKEEAYNNGVLCCKSILSSFYHTMNGGGK